MAGIGLRYPYYAKYNLDKETGAVSYSEGGILGKAVEFSSKVEAASDNHLYADDGIGESDTSFGGGTVGITTDDLTQDAASAILGVVISDYLVGTETVKELIFDESRKPQNLGFGIIIPKKKDGVQYFRAVVFTKIQFGIPEDAAKTMGEKIEWQTPKVEGTIMRDDTPRRKWKRETTVETEELARAYIKSILNITEGDATLSALSLGSLTMTPAFGANVLSYEADTTNATNTITATATDSESAISIAVKGAAVANGSAANWADGENSVVVTVTNGAARMVYTISVTKTL